MLCEEKVRYLRGRLKIWKPQINLLLKITIFLAKKCQLEVSTILRPALWMNSPEQQNFASKVCTSTPQWVRLIGQIAGCKDVETYHWQRSGQTFSGHLLKKQSCTFILSAIRYPKTQQFMIYHIIFFSLNWKVRVSTCLHYFWTNSHHTNNSASSAHSLARFSDSMAAVADPSFCTAADVVFRSISPGRLDGSAVDF